MFKRAVAASALIILAVACAGEEAANADRPQIDRDTLSRRQKDSIIAEMPLPGSGVVGRALETADRANARAELHDSLAGGR